MAPTIDIGKHGQTSGRELGVIPTFHLTKSDTISKRIGGEV
jgi:hypothetical protein